MQPCVINFYLPRPSLSNQLVQSDYLFLMLYTTVCYIQCQLAANGYVLIIAAVAYNHIGYVTLRI